MKQQPRKPIKVIEVILRDKERSPKQKPIRMLPSHKGRILTIIALTGLSIGTSACGGFHVSACSTAGCRAHNDYATGLVNETKTPAGQKGSHYQLREKQASQKSWYEAFAGMFNQGGQ